jgi:hypothetical protein
MALALLRVFVKQNVQSALSWEILVKDVLQSIEVNLFDYDDAYYFFKCLVRAGMEETEIYARIVKYLVIRGYD